MPPELVILLPVAVLAAGYATLFIVEVIDEWRYRSLMRQVLGGEGDGERQEILDRMPELLGMPPETLRAWLDEADAWIDTINPTTRQ